VKLTTRSLPLPAPLTGRPESLLTQMSLPMIQVWAAKPSLKLRILSWSSGRAVAPSEIVQRAALEVGGIAIDDGGGSLSDTAARLPLRERGQRPRPVLDLDPHSPGTLLNDLYGETRPLSCLRQADATVIDGDSANFQGGSLTISLRRDGAPEDQLSIRNFNDGFAGHTWIIGSDICCQPAFCRHGQRRR